MMISRTVPYAHAFRSADSVPAMPLVEPRVPQQAGAAAEKLLDTYRRADNSEATRFDTPAKNISAKNTPAKNTSVNNISAQTVPAENLLSETMPAENLPVNENDQKFRELLHQFVGQTLFGQMLKSLRATQEKNPYFHGGRAEEIFQGQLDMTLSDQLTKTSSKTLSEPMYKLMKKS